MTTANTSLKVPFNEKDQAKALGARWNAEAKQWYVPQGIDAAPFAKWFTDAPSSPTSAAPSRNSTNTTPISAVQGKALDDDMDAINARLRDAFETREFETREFD